ncbi:tetratricopeptide repeat protein [Marinigracilibium pacificum]|uniref:Tetratricopeptide repeat protein n=1 Tax=Marinigracilibium pacificum TaxID=2729599 RepID=A0A848J0L3_9BACT|nr:tetratricopeptide repeat protein [Marinigracilibium pacificum]NMM48090.1 tetratricopeptide repeat protein [Marinigracilibium pacificum]
MNKKRIELLKSYIKEDSSDPFNYYALALEYLGENSASSKEYFVILLTNFPNYLPTYYHAAHYFMETDPEQTAKIFEDGIKLAQQQGDFKALAELQNAYTNWQFEQE